MDLQITQWLHEDQSEDEEACEIAVPDLENDVDEDGIIEDFRAEHPDDDTEDSSSGDDTPLSNYSSGNFLRVLPVPYNLKGKYGLGGQMKNQQSLESHEEIFCFILLDLKLQLVK
ncbi:unnamed protein product [Parnassius apollo]|uniref:(apollo) hypothetical protein n=1 Tax=Parnassius apollo TaxID=110799 RepID=A0A8S3XFQ2_PARAO|nr:unnamed protein product [Parnassius apollo]